MKGMLPITLTLTLMPLGASTGGLEMVGAKTAYIHTSNRTPSLADFITITSGFKFSVHTAVPRK